ncbi:LysR family transcriptional regulator [Rhodococcus sp. BP-252]|uniref:LysR family transcriptional regulator n=1 Tax=unclassified Rhodococcus (in: high G+C Gram-positive bacteria) TaxID=192944 RepID=UPI001C9B441A|nr:MULTISPECIES: LysR family transcriptional regulator [unclassified Rhodococcus (in: high G+C Gram-positive bacteria)]MBY6412820.1 LysR family transcriptional regulator [Rhodococcus sp. BP-320]MBY6417643.1 LysR family transcriptional regulator [Rhodococcus sp. BP-321]MBY6423495.1 LysR family transcriptional regulator [Rhodococcus sp. BP-324]MBY6427667.1 LysR family transcriptional regulator [Rhodococcus sp. BP-323]MBY6432831.1 LysR family transcriptional regulator [Rhodococcus sp. BP-322]
MADIDLNLIRTFVLLYQTRSVTAAAGVLSVTQPSVSHGLKRLRKHFADDLFERSPSGLEPTQVATRLYPDFQQALEVIDSASRAVSTFDPATSTRAFRLLATDLGEVAFLPAIVERLRHVAPAVRLEVAPLDFATVESDLRQNHADAAIFTPRVTAPDLRRDVLLRDEYVGLCAAEHEGFGDPPSMVEFSAARHVAVTDSSGHVEVDRALADFGLPRDIALQVPHFSALPRIVERSDLVAVVPQSVSGWFCRLANVRVFPLPFDVRSVEISLYTHRRLLPSPSAEWFREVICNSLGQPAN